MKLSARFAQPAITNYNQVQTATLGKSLLWGGGGFVGIALISFLISYFAFGWYNPDYNIIENIFNNNYDLYYGIFWSIALIGMIVGSILMMTWSFSIERAGWTRIIITYIVEILAWGSCFGIIMGMYNGWEIVFALSLAGIIFLLMGLVGSIMSVKIGLTLMKIIGIGTGVLLIVNLIFWLIINFTLMGNNISGYANQGNLWWMIVEPIFTIFAVGYVAIDFFIISKSPYFNVQLSSQQTRKIEAYYGLQLLTDFVYLLYLILMLIRTFRND